MIIEIFKPIIIDGCETNYLVGDKGTVKNKLTRKKLKHHPHGTYVSVNLVVNGKHRSMLLHRLVAIAFIPNPDNKPTVNHKDGTPEGKWNNRSSNLEWATKSEQNIHAYNTGLRRMGESNPITVFTDEDAHIVCIKLSEGYDVQDIVHEYGFERSFVDRIRKGEIWKNISKHYEIPQYDSKFRHNKNFPRYLKQKVYDLYKKNINTKPSKVLETIDLPNTLGNKSIISKIKQRVIKENG